MSFTHIDCFCGPGGLCTGLHAAGFDTLAAIDSIKSCVDTYAANHPGVHMIHRDIRDVSENDLLPFIPEDGVDLVPSGMPCETFSTAGNTSRSFYDDRQFLFREGIRIAKIAKAKLLLFENVPAITTKTVSRRSRKLVVDVLKKELAAAGYKHYIEVVLSADQFGVPQRRSRFFLLASRDMRLYLTAPVPSGAAVRTVADAFAGLPNVIPNSAEEATSYTGEESDYSRLMKDRAFWKLGAGTDRLTYQMPMKHRACTLERFSLLRPGESLKDLFMRYSGQEREQLQHRRVLPQKMFIKRNYRLIASEPSPTVTSHCLDEFVHPVYDRALTVRECARLQSFPNGYDFCGGPYLVPHVDRNIQDKYEQIGDAVPPLLACAWGTTLIQILRSAEDMPDPKDYKAFCREVYQRAYQEAYPVELGERTTAAAMSGRP